MASANTFESALNYITPEEVRPLADILNIRLTTPSGEYLNRFDKEALWNELSYLGSNDIAYLFRGMEGVGYAEIVRDVCSKMNVTNIYEQDSEEAVVHNETALMQQLFADMWDSMSDVERDALTKSRGESNESLNGKLGIVVAAQIATKLGGFAAYEIAVIVANTVARAILGRGLAFGVNAALTQTLSVFAGPIGWAASGAWLVCDLASPALSKTVPAVIQVAALRQVSRRRMSTLERIVLEAGWLNPAIQKATSLLARILGAATVA